MYFGYIVLSVYMHILLTQAHTSIPTCTQVHTHMYTLVHTYTWIAHMH